MDYDFGTLSETMNQLTLNGYPNTFAIETDCILCTNNEKAYQPEDLLIVKTFRFDGMTNPDDDVELFAIEANDGTNGTLTVSYGANSPKNSELVRDIPIKE